MSTDWNATTAWREHGGRFLRGIKLRIVASLVTLVGGVIFVLFYLAFLAQQFTWYQNLAVVFSVILLVPVALVTMWVLWGLGMARRVAFD